MSQPPTQFQTRLLMSHPPTHPVSYTTTNVSTWTRTNTYGPPAHPGLKDYYRWPTQQPRFETRLLTAHPPNYPNAILLSHPRTLDWNRILVFDYLWNAIIVHHWAIIVGGTPPTLSWNTTLGDPLTIPSDSNLCALGYYKVIDKPYLSFFRIM